MSDHNDSQAVDYDRLVAQETLLFDAAERVAELINDAGISRTELAERLGKSKGFVTQILAGDRNMTLRTLADLGHVLGYSFDIVAKPAKRTPTTSGGDGAGSARTVVAHPGHECPMPGRRRVGQSPPQVLSSLDFRRIRVGGAPSQPPPAVYTKVSAQ
jgi:transcriptional regulator with XRE-family HTH domain